MRSSSVAFVLFAIYLSSSSYASSIAPRDGHIAFPTDKMVNVESSSNYPTEGTSDPSPPAPANPSTPDSKHITDAQANTAPPPLVASLGDKKDTPSNYPDGNAAPQPETPSNYPDGNAAPQQPGHPASSTPPPTPETAKDPKQGEKPPVTPPPAAGDNKPSPIAPVSPPAGSDLPQNPSAPKSPADNSIPAPAGSSTTSPGGDSTPPPADHPTGPAAPADGQDTGNTSPSPSTSSSNKQCPTYMDANTDHAACGPEGTPITCTGGCTGPIIAQLCQLNETSPNTTETCTNAYRESSATVHVCINDAGAFSCRGPATGALNCNGCSSGQGGNGTADSEGASPGTGSSNDTTPGTPGGDSGNSAGAFLSPFNALLTSAFTLVGGALLL